MQVKQTNYWACLCLCAQFYGFQVQILLTSM